MPIPIALQKENKVQKLVWQSTRDRRCQEYQDLKAINAVKICLLPEAMLLKHTAAEGE